MVCFHFFAVFIDFPTANDFQGFQFAMHFHEKGFGIVLFEHHQLMGSLWMIDIEQARAFSQHGRGILLNQHDTIACIFFYLFAVEG